MRHARVCIQDSGRIGTDAEKRCTREIENTGIAELDIESESCHRVQQHGNHKQKNEVIVVKDRCHGTRGADGTNGQSVLWLKERRAHILEQTKPGCGKYSRDTCREQKDDQVLLFSAKQ